ncbi:MAG TPA: OmpA family protein [Kofleriaceae bacterium]|nr:OmpA family protein [Kofleriaceae bacterium]
MKHVSLGLLVALAGSAHADPPPRGPDFAAPVVPPRAVDRSLAASDGDATIAPTDEVMFATGSCALDGTAVVALDAIAMWMAEHPRFQLAIEGHGGASAAADAADLAARRAESVRVYLARRGVASDRLVVIVSPTPRSLVEVFASDRSPAEIARASIETRGAVAARWTERWSPHEEQPGLGAAIATRR